MHTKKNSLFLIFVLTIISCKYYKSDILFNKSEVNSLMVSFYKIENVDTSFSLIINDKSVINDLFDKYLSKSSEAVGKFPIKYSIVMFKNDIPSDTLYFSDVDYRSSKTGTRKMKSNIDDFFKNISNSSNFSSK